MSEATPATTQKLAADFDRRAFFTKIGLGSLGIAAAGTIVFSYEYLSPNVLYEPSAVFRSSLRRSIATESRRRRSMS